MKPENNLDDFLQRIHEAACRRHKIIVLKPVRSKHILQSVLAPPASHWYWQKHKTIQRN